MITKEELDKLRNEYPVGCRVILKKMDDAQAPPIGTKGWVRGIDDIGNVLMRWDNGSSLNVIYNEDKIEKVKCKKCGKDIIGYPALSRENNKDEICSECGTRESLELIGKTTDEINEVVDKINEMKEKAGING